MMKRLLQNSAKMHSPNAEMTDSSEKKISEKIKVKSVLMFSIPIVVG
jgi:hypothetical protein